MGVGLWHIGVQSTLSLPTRANSRTTPGATLRSRECQVRHWKHGGHKHKCTDLAAARRSGRAEWRQ